MASPLAVFARGLASRTLVARGEDGRAVPAIVERWLRPATGADERALERVASPVLDIGCGPGRHVVALADRGVPALGIDISADAVRLARRRGAAAVRRSVFAHDVPWPGRWGAALLLDGNIGIGGDPAALLRCVTRRVLRRDGHVLAELEAPGAPTGPFAVRLESSDAVSSHFPWARVGTDGLDDLLAASGCALRELWEDGGRHFALVAAA